MDHTTTTTTTTESCCVPPGFRFHPTDEELVGYYLRKKVASQKIDLDVIRDIDLYRIEPWDLQDICRIGYEEQNEWYFFSHKDKKYPTGTRTNRATMAGFWKATGRDKAVYDKTKLIGMRKTLVFYKGRAPNGQKTDWIMHEYRLESEENGPPQEEGWVACRAFKKRTTGQTKSSSSSNIEGWDSTYYYDHYNEPPAAAAAANSSSTGRHVSSVHHVDQHSIDYITRQPSNLTTMCKQETEPAVVEQSTDQFVQLPQLESPSLPPIKRPAAASILSHATGMINNDYDNDKCIRGSKSNGKNKVTTDWRDLDKFVASQLSHGDGYQGNDVGSSFDSEYSDLGFLLLQNVREEEGPNLNELSTSDADIGISIFNK